MPKQRIQVQSGVPESSLIAPARPVDTFVQPAESVKLEQLAQGLAHLAPGLEGLSDVLQKRNAESQFAAGVSHARKLAESAASFRDAIAAGKITANQSPWFMAGLKEQFGRLAADRMNFEFQSAAEVDQNLQTTVDPADFDAFYTKFRDEWIATNLDPKSRDSYFEKGFGHKIDEHLSANQQAFASQLSSRVLKFAGEGLHSEIMNVIATELPRGTSQEQIVASIADRAHLSIQQGLNGRIVNLTTVKAVIQSAWSIAQTGQNGDELKAMKVLEMLDHIPGGTPGSTLGSTSYGAPLLAEARQQIATALATRQERDQRNADQLRENTTRTRLGSVIQRLASASDASTVNLNADVLALASDPTAVASLQSLQSNVVSLQNRTSEGVAEDLLGRIWVPDGRAPVSERTLVTMMTQGQLNRHDAAWLQSQIEQERNSHIHGPEYGLLHEEWYENAYSNLGGRFGSMIQDMGDRGDRRANAQASLTSQWLTWRNGEGATADSQTRIKWLSDATDRLAIKYRSGLPNSPFTSPKAQINPSTQPKWETVVMPGVTASILSNMAQEALTGHLSLQSRQIMQQYGLEVSNLRAFLGAQSSLLKKGTP